MGAGIGVYPNGWDSPEVQQACGYTSKAYNMGRFILFSKRPTHVSNSSTKQPKKLLHCLLLMKTNV